MSRPLAKGVVLGLAVGVASTLVYQAAVNRTATYSLSEVAVQGNDWNVFSAPWSQTKRMVCEAVREDNCTLKGECTRLQTKAGPKLLFDFDSNQIKFAKSFAGIPPDNISGRTFYVLDRRDPEMALLMGDTRVLKLRYTLKDPNRDLVTIDSSGRLVARKSGQVLNVAPDATLTGYAIEYSSLEIIGKEDTLRAVRFECTKAE